MLECFQALARKRRQAAQDRRSRTQRAKCLLSFGRFLPKRVSGDPGRPEGIGSIWPQRDAGPLS